MSDESPEASHERLIRQVELLKLENRALLAHLAGTGSADRFVQPDHVVLAASELTMLRETEADLDTLLELITTDPAAALIRRRRRFQQIARRRRR